MEENLGRYKVMPWFCTDVPIMTSNIVEIKLGKICYSAIKIKKSSRTEPLTGRLSGKVLYNRVTTMGLR